MLPKTTVFGIEFLWRFLRTFLVRKVLKRSSQKQKEPLFGALCFFENLYPIKLYTQKTKGMVATESKWEINAMPAAAEVSCP